MIGPTLALLSSVVSGLSVVLVGRYSKESNALNMSLVISCVGTAILWPLAVLLTDFSGVNLEGFALFAIGGLLTPGLVRLFYYGGLKRLGTSVNASVFSIYPLYSSLLAVVMLSEILSIGNWAGIFCVVVGVVFVEMSSTEINGGKKSARKNLLFPIFGGLTLGISSIIRKYALDVCNAPVFGVAVAYTFSLIPYFLMLTLHAPTRKEISLKRDFQLFWKAGIGQAFSWILSFYALSYERVSIIAPLLSTEPLFVVFCAYFYLRELEHVSPKLVVSIALTVLGVILVVT